jgi:hypothetical protein
MENNTEDNKKLEDIEFDDKKVDEIDFDDNCIYVIWYKLYTGKHKNSKIQTYLENSPVNLKRDVFFEYLWESQEIDNIFKLIGNLIEEKLDFHMLKFRNDINNWVVNYLSELVP